MNRAYRDMTKAEPLQKLADASLMQMHAEPACNPVAQIDTAIARDPIAGEVGAIIHPRRDLRLLRLRQPCRTAAAWAIG